MDTLNAGAVIEAVRDLRAAAPKVFGADGHMFMLNPPAPLQEVLDFERAHGIALPNGYRRFLTEIGNGGAGPYYGVFPLGQMDGTGTDLQTWHSGDEIVGILAEPFLLRGAWNDLTRKPEDDLEDTDATAYEQRLDEFEAEYWNPARMNGCLPICHMGCALRVWLVVTGDEAGHVWFDGRVDYSGLAPVHLRDGSKATFTSWYMEWLHDALRARDFGRHSVDRRSGA